MEERGESMIEQIQQKEGHGMFMVSLSYVQGHREGINFQLEISCEKLDEIASLNFNWRFHVKSSMKWPEMSQRKKRLLLLCVHRGVRLCVLNFSPKLSTNFNVVNFRSFFQNHYSNESHIVASVYPYLGGFRLFGHLVWD